MAASKSGTRITCRTGPNISSSGAPLDVGDVDQGRGEEGAIVGLAVEPADGAAALAEQIEKGVLQMVGGAIVDHRAHEGRRAWHADGRR